MLWTPRSKHVGLIRLHRLKLFVFLSDVFGTCCLMVYIRPGVRQPSNISCTSYQSCRLQYSTLFHIILTSNIRRVMKQNVLFLSFNQRYAWLFRAGKVLCKSVSSISGRKNCKWNFPKIIFKILSWRVLCGKQHKILDFPALNS
jgi:hypothetical protein